MSGPAIQRLARWRTLFAGWQLGTRAKGDPEGDAVRDHREVTILLRAEMNALLGLLVEKEVITFEEFAVALEREADLLSADYARRFPGIRAADHGLEFVPHIAADTMRGWRP
mgnify:FL=1